MFWCLNTLMNPIAYHGFWCCFQQYCWVHSLHLPGPCRYYLEPLSCMAAARRQLFEHHNSRDATRSLFWEENKPFDRRKVSFPGWNKRLRKGLFYKPKLTFRRCPSFGLKAVERENKRFPCEKDRKSKFWGSKHTFFRNVSLKLETQNKLRWS